MVPAAVLVLRTSVGSPPAFATGTEAATEVAEDDAALDVLPGRVLQRLSSDRLRGTTWFTLMPCGTGEATRAATER